MSIAKAFKMGQHDKQFGLYPLADYYGLTGITSMAYAIGRAI